MKYDILIQRISYFVLLVFLLLIGMFFLNDKGTHDVGTLLKWGENIRQYGLRGGFIFNSGDYPPLASFFLQGVNIVSSIFGVSTLIVYKILLFLTLFLSSLFYYYFTKNILLTVILYISLMIGTMALGYMDIIFLFPLIISLWALYNKKIMVFSIFYSISFFIKWQPIIILPFIIIYLWDYFQIKSWKDIFSKDIIKVVAPPAVLSYIFLLYFGQYFLRSFAAALGHKYISGNAFNFGWIVTYFCNVFEAGKWNISVHYLAPDSLLFWVFAKILFFIIFGGIIYLWSKQREKVYFNLILYSLVGYLAYFTFNTGVHENHLFTAVVLISVLFWLNRGYLIEFLFLIIYCNLNLILLYGLEGNGIGFSRIIGIDISVFFSALFTIFFCCLLFKVYISSTKLNISHINNNYVT